MPDEQAWKPLELVKVAADYLSTKGVPNPRLDAELLLLHAVGLGRRVDLYAGFEREISGKELSSYRELVKRRASREPVSRILGRRGFMGLDFQVTPDVLSPRPETEHLVEAALEVFQPRKALPDPAVSEVGKPVSEELARFLDRYGEDVDDAGGSEPEWCPPTGPKLAAVPIQRNAPAARPKPERLIRALDLGTGSGCIAVALAARLPGAEVVAVDASPKALAVARRNAASAGVAGRVDFRQGDWFAGCRQGEAFDLIVSNPPYLVEGDPDIWPEVRVYDPPLALYGGRDGLDAYRRIVPAVPDWLVPGGQAFFEVGIGQAEKVTDLLLNRGFREVRSIKDYGGVERVVGGRVE
ncbi:MAG: peptide chain release factor N(5)-glutamine methyltransferase [Planctomycetes bacterium]|nr:peptide chain release factor N(5)-glutamine methyltransferase [Planctomycetota bacterium]